MTVIKMRGITKRFPGVLANSGVDLDLQPGEIHGLLGENGAGKTTLMNILFGLYQPDEGEIFIDDRPQIIRSPAQAIELGIGMVHQHFKLVPPFTVTENIILGMSGKALINMRPEEDKVAQLAQQYNLKIDPTAQVQTLSVGEQQRVEILSSLYRGVQVLILDEPTAVLTPQEVDALAEILQEMAKQGKSIVFITHKMEEVFRITQRVTVLRAGKLVYTAQTKDTNKNVLAREMIGHELKSLAPRESQHILTLVGDLNELQNERSAEQRSSISEKVLLEIQNLRVLDERRLPELRDISFQLHAGEILGIAGVDGNGQKGLVETILRLRTIQSGKLWVDGQDATHWSTQEFNRHHTAYITDDRQGDGLVLNFDLNRNAVLKIFEQEPFSRHGLLNFKAIQQFTRELITNYDIRTPNANVHAGTLSGGNQQKLILARELSQKPILVLANKPTRGLDIGATAYIHEQLRNERDRKAGILLISADLDELLLLSDRILVMFNGTSMGILEAGEANPELLGLMMAGTPLADYRKGIEA